MKDILVVKNLMKKYSSNVSIGELSFSVKEGEFVGLVGESGCGKSTIAKILTGIETKTSGEIDYSGKRKIQMIFQNPYNSLNPNFKVKDILSEGIRYQKIKYEEKNLEEYLLNLLREVGLEAEVLEKYPGQLSGGQCQRVGIARVFSVKSDMIIADESLASLDLLTQAQIVALFERIKKEKKVSCLFISHDLFVVRKLCDKILIMKDGKIIEFGETEEIFRNPKQKETKYLLKASLGFLEKK